MPKPPPDSTEVKSAAWTEKWLAAVADGSLTMSQRKLSAVEQKGGGLARVRAAARKHRVHLVLLEDDHGEQLLAASLKPFRVIC